MDAFDIVADVAPPAGKPPGHLIPSAFVVAIVAVAAIWFFGFRR